MIVLQSYLAGKWIQQPDNAVLLPCAITGDPVASLGKSYLDAETMRLHAKTCRAELHAALSDAAAQAARSLLDAIRPKAEQTVALYEAIQSELNCAPLMASLREQGIACALPRVVAKDKPLMFHRYQPGDSCQESAYGVREPLTESAVCEPDIIVVPLLAFDRHGFRLGYGGGFYDRTLQSLRRRKTILAIGYGFAGQEVAEVPRDAHDEPLDAIITDQGAVRLER